MMETLGLSVHSILSDRRVTECTCHPYLYEVQSVTFRARDAPINRANDIYTLYDDIEIDTANGIEVWKKRALRAIFYV